MKKLFFLILGLPRSGSTLLTNLINSQPTGFCASEPLWENENFHKVKTFGKILPPLDSLRTQDIPSFLKNQLNTNNFTFGGYKETYRNWQFDYLKPHINNDLDFIIKIYRDPVQNFGSWKKKKNWGKQYDSATDFVTCYNNFKDITFKKVYNIQYEDILKGGIDYLNETLPISFSTEKITSYGFTYGDARANLSTNINPPLPNSNLSVDELDYLKNNINDKSFVL